MLLCVHSFILAHVWFFLHASYPDIENHIVYIIDCAVSYNFSVWTDKFNVIRATYELFDYIRHSCMCVPYLMYKFACSTFKIMFFRLYILDCCVSFDSHIRTQKSHIRWASYEVFHLLTHSCVCITHLWHKFAFLSCLTPQLSKSHFLDFIS